MSSTFHSSTEQSLRPSQRIRRTPLDFAAIFSGLLLVLILSGVIFGQFVMSVTVHKMGRHAFFNDRANYFQKSTPVFATRPDYVIIEELLNGYILN